jgi:hypothetical protein
LDGEEGPSVAHAANINSAIETKTICADCLILTMLSLTMLILTICSPCAVVALRFGR